MPNLKKNKFFLFFLVPLLGLQSLLLLVLVGGIVSKKVGQDQIFNYSITRDKISAAQHGAISLEFDQDSFYLQVDSKQEVEYHLAYQTEDGLETIEGTGQDDPSLNKEILAGTCSDGECTLHQGIEVGVLKVKIGDTNQVNSLSFNLEQNQVTFVHFQTTSNFDLSDQDQEFLNQKLLMTPDELATYVDPLETLRPYRLPFNSKFWLNFYQLPDETKKVSLQEKTVDSSLVSEINAFSNQFFAVHTNMVEGNYTYDLSLPLPDNYQDEDIVIRRADEVSGPYQELDVDYEVDDDIIVVKDLQQAGVFAVTKPGSAIVANPTLADTCGLDMVLVLDTSGSIDNNELQQMKEAFYTFVDAFIPATPTQIAVVEFDTQARLLQDFSHDSSQIKNAIDQGSSGGWTNWQDALDVAGSLDFPRASKADLVVFSSDGHPTRPLNQYYTQENLELAKESANQIKQDQIRIMSLGIGNDLHVDNLKVVSGPSVDTGDINTDIITTDFDQLANDLSQFAQQLCNGKILIQKQLDMNKDGDLEDELDIDGSSESQYLADWEFNLEGDKDLTKTTDNSGTLEFKVDPGQYSLVETLPDDYQQQSFVCQRDSQEIGQQTQLGVTDIKIGQEELVSCKVINQPVVAWSDKTVLFLEKSNNHEEDQLVAGDDVTYTLRIKAPEQPVQNVEVMDLMPEGFSYRKDSWTATSNYRGDLKKQGITLEPDYQSPGQWTLGDMEAGEEVTLTLTADIDSDQEPGTYPDLAVAEGQDRQGQVVYANEATYFVGTEVEIVDQRQSSQTINIEKQVTKEKVKDSEAEDNNQAKQPQPILPRTGLSSIWLSLSLTLVVSGIGFLLTAWIVYQQTKYQLDLKEHKIDDQK